jgi:broad specificity phosphatase PhoE
MKLILLRHEHRFEPPLFFTSLTPVGLEKSVGLIESIKEYNPDIIYSSPFLRTIQTIRPYAVQENKKIRIDYSLYEYIHAADFTKENYKHHVTELDDNIYKDIIADYEPLIQPEELIHRETEDDIRARVYNFVNYITNMHENQTVLIVSHMSTLNMIKRYYDKKTVLGDELHVGKLTPLI